MDYRDLLELAKQGSRGFTTGLLGAPVDIANTMLGGAGGQSPVMGSQWIGNQLSSMGLLAPAPQDAGGRAAEFAGGLLGPGDAFKAPLLLGALKPTMFFRGTNPGAAERIRTGARDWDSYLFASSDPKQARNYGSDIERIAAKPDARILYEGTQEFRSVAKQMPKDVNMLEWAREVASRAKDAGYDAVHFKQQGNIGTPIMNEDAFIRRLPE